MAQVRALLELLVLAVAVPTWQPPSQRQYLELLVLAVVALLVVLEALAVASWQL